MTDTDLVAAFAAAFRSLKDDPEADKYLCKCSVGASGNDPKITLLFPRFKEDEPDIQSFIEWLWLQAINYAIPLRKRQRARAAASESATGGDMSAASRLVAETKRLFMAFNAANPSRSGEMGEVLAYLIGLAYLEAPQIASKMALKTNPNMPVHGLDGVHASFLNSVMTLYFLEAKVHESFNSASRSYAASIADFWTNRTQYLVEYETLAELGNLAALDTAHRQTALEYFDVYGSRKSQRLERSVGVLCYSELKHYSSKLAKDSGRPPSAHEAHYSASFMCESGDLQAAVQSHLADAGMDPKMCEVFVVAVPDVAKLRELFAEQMK
jgi:hypothetical protein